MPKPESSFVRGYESGNFAYAYETQNFETWKQTHQLDNETDAYRIGALMGFFSSLETHEVPSELRELVQRERANEANRQLCRDSGISPWWIIYEVDSIQIPSSYVELCHNWYGGQDCMLYAVSSTGNLTLGNRKPLGVETREQWYLSIWQSLSVDVGYARRSAAKSNHEDLEELAHFETWVDQKCEIIAESFDLTEWEGA